jgi:TPR repeat protein
MNAISVPTIYNFIDFISLISEREMKKIILAAMFSTICANANAIEDTRKSCAAGDAKSCKIMGDLTRAGLGVEQNDTKAYNYYDRACFDGDKDACKELALLNKDKI